MNPQTLKQNKHCNGHLTALGSLLPLPYQIPPQGEAHAAPGSSELWPWRSTAWFPAHTGYSLTIVSAAPWSHTLMPHLAKESLSGLKDVSLWTCEFGHHTSLPAPHTHTHTDMADSSLHTASYLYPAPAELLAQL